MGLLEEMALVQAAMQEQEKQAAAVAASRPLMTDTQVLCLVAARLLPLASEDIGGGLTVVRGPAERAREAADLAIELVAEVAARVKSGDFGRAFKARLEALGPAASNRVGD